MDVLFYKKIKININNTFKHFNINWNICKSQKKRIKFFGESVVFEARDINIKKLEEIKNVKKNK